jgi:hypothetical protein
MLLIAASVAHSQIRITEWMYLGANGEFIEFTNMGSSPVDMADNWFYTDSDRGVMDVNLRAFGTIQPGESVIITETEESAFRAAWALGSAVKVIGSNLNSNLGRVDEINVYHSGTLADRLTFGDNRIAADPPAGAPPTAGSIRAQNRSGNPTSLAALGVNDVFQWVLASTAAQGEDSFGTYSSVVGGDRANPGLFKLAVTQDGDFNDDGVVDAADYVVWRYGLGTQFSEDDYDIWRADFGRVIDSGTNNPLAQGSAIPEPVTLANLLLVMALGATSWLNRDLAIRRRASRRQRK